MGIISRTVRWPAAVLSALILGLAVTGVAPLSPATPVQATSQSADPIKVMVVGDSISQGKAGDWTWRYRFVARMTAGGQSVAMVGPRTWLYNRQTGQQGDQHYVDRGFDRDHDALWGQPLFVAERTIRPDVAKARPDVLLVLLGINDLLMFDRTPAAIESSLRAFVADARVANPHIGLVLGTLLPTQRARVDPSFAACVTDYNRRLRAVAAELDRTGSAIRVAETGAKIVPMTDLYDGLHPNARGEVKIATAFVTGMADLGSPRANPPPRR